MALVLDGVTRVVRGQVHIHPTDLTLEQGDDERPARADALRQDQR